jgi:biopolymer transport protein ExbB/TolQ
MTSTALIAAPLVWVLLVAGVLRTMRIARHVDELAARQWDGLARIRSATGIAFFPTSYARVELEVAIADAVAARGRRAVRDRVPAAV